MSKKLVIVFILVRNFKWEVVLIWFSLSVVKLISEK